MIYSALSKRGLEYPQVRQYLKIFSARDTFVQKIKQYISFD